MFFKINKFRKALSFSLILIILLNLIISYKICNAEDYSSWIIAENYDNEYLTVKSITPDTIVLKGEHHEKQNDNYYITDGFVMTLDPYVTSGKFPESAKNNVIDDVKQPDPNDVEGDETVITLYNLNFADIVGMAGKLGVTGEQLSKGPVPVYLHVIYDIFKGKTRLVNDVIGVQEMLNAPEKYKLGYTAWDSRTIKVIPSYYNLRFDLGDCAYNYKIVAVDKDEKVLKTLQEPQKAIYKQDMKYNLPTDKKNIAIGKDKYTCKNYFYYKYYKRPSNNKLTKSSNTTGTNVNMKAPDAEPGSTLTIYIPYEPVNPITPTPKPSVTPKPGVPTPTPIPNIPEVEVPQEDSAALPFTEVENGGIIQADNRGGEKFNAILGVPTTESLYGQVTAKEYLLGYTFIKKVGIKYYPIKVTKNYILNWKTATPDSAGGGKPLTETVPVTQTVTVARAYGYWEIENLECYKISNAVLNNYALPNGSIAINPNYFYYSPLSVNVSHSSSEGTHIIPPDEFTKGITLPSETISDKGTTKPTIPSEDFSNEAISAAWDRTGKIKVKSDSLIFNGATVMNSAVTEYDAPDLNLSAIPQCDTFINDNVLYKPNQLIDATKENGHYGSTGSITYTSIANVNPTKLNNIEYPIGGINQVVIHTPVICKPSITADNDKYVQLINPTSGCVQLVLDPDPDLSDFIINISNYGPHSDKVGYYTRDFSRSLHNPDVSYIAEKSGILRNEVRFPFDVYVDVGNDKKTANDEYVKAGTWMTIGRASPRLYLPMWTEEGVYTVDFRTVAVNGENFINKTQEEKNSNLINYVATDTLRVEVSGRIYGLTMYDLSDYPMWEETFRVPNSSRLKKDDPKYIDGTKRNIYSKDYSYTYTLGTNDQYGNDTGRNIKYTFPLVNGSHPLYKNIGVLKTGYMTRFSIETIGSMYDDGSTISIKPSFYFVDSKGKNRTAVDLYYTEEIYGKSRHLVKVGGSTDLTNLKSFTTGDLHLSIPEKEMRLTAKLRKTPYEDFIFHRDAMFGFSQIRLNSTFRTYVNEDYTEKIKALDSYEAVKKSGIIEDDISMRKQHWYGQYYIPNEVHAVAKGFDVMDYADKYGVDYSENFWLKDGYIIVNINIETVEDGKPRLSYTNAINYKNNGNCSMWIMEGPPLTKTDNKGVTFNFYAGDFIIYYANKRASDDYSAGAIY